ncbi:serine/threonine-protein kinase [Pseudonocardia kunmingensis]|uniref:non-specific serine/threonine protein kinase n=1 Tax=Pseudonocardia kunmingensis TaxID=630975 RepID=A0A543CY99_9PSEU|nr:serine/threonine-protein kinase [Pseudonocardia kunmingensis]TQM02077.1 serine/threonine-protein kinase PknG [Pseudonocardia kunmingensis]
MTAADGAPCARPGCAGTLQDGYCDECGHAPAQAGASTGGASGATVDPGTAAWSPSTGSGTAAWSPSTGTAASTGPSTGTSGSRPSRRGTGRTSTSSSAGGRLGAGLVDVPPVPQVDPSSALLIDPQVPEHKRVCSRCGGPVGRSKDGRPGRVEGFCPRDGAPFSFRPKLEPGVLVDGQYEVQGCLAHGGLGWIYLALDRKVSDRWVVLKGLLDSGDADAMAAAAAEARFLAQIRHPDIVTIHNFAQHPGDDGTPVGYIVMEYVGGVSLKQLLEDRRRPDGTLEPLPVAQAIAYAIEILPALGFLHSRGLAYCDFKPENVIQYERQLKLIDLGAVIRLDDERSPVYGTIGYQAPEIATVGPSPSSDVHTVGRTLAVLTLGIPPARRGVPTPLPEPSENPVLARHESFHRLLRRATDPDPLRRFGSAEEMADQLGGVLREVLAAEGGHPAPRTSTIFGPRHGDFAPDLLAAAGEPGRPEPAQVAARLPDPVAGGDPASSLLVAASSVDLDDVRRMLASSAQQGTEMRLMLLRAHLGAGDPDAATEVLDGLGGDDLDDWRREWFRGVIALSAGRTDAACAAFDTVYATLPGEMVPKLALAAAAECAGQDAVAGHHYGLVARPDPSIADAAFGLARVLARAGDRAGAVAALDAIPETSSRYVAAQLAAVQVVLLGCAPAEVEEAELRSAADRVERLALAPATDLQVRASLLVPAVELVSVAGEGGAPFLGCPWRERDLRFALERCLRTSARLTTDRAERIGLVDRANAVRPLTWV